MDKHVHRLGGEEVTLLSHRALLWQRTLFVADLHFGKDAMLRHAHHWAPPGATADTLARLGELLQSFTPERVVLLGDVFHTDRVEETVPDIRPWRDRYPDCDFLAIPGNHDRRAENLARACGFTTAAEGTRLGPWILRHHPDETPRCFTLCGHVHPLARLRGPGRQTLRLPCFLLGPTQAILPAFGVFTGGHPVRPQAQETVVAIADDRLVILGTGR